VYDGRPFLLDEHVGRLVASSKTLGIGGLPPENALSALIREVISRNGFSNALIRTTVSRGVSDGWEPDPAARPSLVVVGRAFSGYPDHLYRDGASIVVTTIRMPASDLDPVLKSLNRLPQVQAKREAMTRGADEAVLCTDTGLVAEGCVSNVFCVDAGRIITPPASVGLLPGITRGVVIDLARREGLACDEAPFGPEDLQGADEVFLTSTGMEVLPVTRVDGRQIGGGRPGPIASALRRRYHIRIRESGSERSLPSP
jgi:branched-chain amino acid aminotransferase